MPWLIYGRLTGCYIISCRNKFNIHDWSALLIGIPIPLHTVTPIRNDRGRFRSPHSIHGPARPELPPHEKEGRNEAVGKPNQPSTPRRNPRSLPGARRKEERGRPSGPDL